jgi:hypothetical protein
VSESVVLVGFVGLSREALRRVDLEKEVQQLPSQLNAVVMESGDNFSTGTFPSCTHAALRVGCG